MKILFIGDIVGKPGRAIVTQLLPSLKKELQLDFVIANVENLAHGKGITQKTWAEMQRAGVDVGTGGNHTVSKDDARMLLAEPGTKLIRPANVADLPGSGDIAVAVGSAKVRVLNLIGQAFMDENVASPFKAADELLTGKPNITILDMHAEATSEKVAMGWHLDGRVSAVIGTHTHVPTADTRILPGGTAYVTDAGMCGLRDAIIGVDREAIMPRFLTGEKKTHAIAEHGPAVFNAILLDLDDTGHARSISRIDREVAV
jgi:2',3'-cyclic-nucleotide 2'-phosphodiesterase